MRKICAYGGAEKGGSGAGRKKHASKKNGKVAKFLRSRSAGIQGEKRDRQVHVGKIQGMSEYLRHQPLRISTERKRRERSIPCEEEFAVSRSSARRIRKSSRGRKAVEGSCQRGGRDGERRLATLQIWRRGVKYRGAQ